MTLPEPIAAYFAAKNKHDIEAMLVPFSIDAIVKDEGQELHGLGPIRTWMKETTRKYRVTVEPTGIADDGGRTVVTALVSGDFPGSPAELRYRFRLDAGKIARLEIG